MNPRSFLGDSQVSQRAPSFLWDIKKRRNQKFKERGREGNGILSVVKPLGIKLLLLVFHEAEDALRKEILLVMD